MTRRKSHDRVGFDFAIAEECGRYGECEDYRALFGDHVVVIEYRLADFRRACKSVGKRLTVVLRDVDLTTPASPSYRYADC